ncbi:GMC oxidoreductase [Streptomyces sp. NPDC050617]|uniref:GMC family oxidoreductase n=1 Tax=Streptomyces sp. NPDC050617 TaxID=3154628 RepID=UPI003418146C
MPRENPVDPARDPADRDEFDYVVVGGGTAGAVVAARLSENRDVTVCVLEAGPSDVGDENILRLDRWMGLLESGYDWDYPVEPQENGNSFMRHARAKVLGGCSSHNSCIAFWAPAEDLDEWAAQGCTGWGAADCFPLYRRLESNDAPGDHHGRTGPVTIRTVPPHDPCGAALLAACTEAGIPTTPFNTGKTVVRGANWFQINARADGTRSSASVSYLHPLLGGGRPNLEVRTGLQARRLVLAGDGDGDRRCTGVEYLAPDLIRTRTVAARRETVVACGAIDSPKLLMLSGIGPAGHLRETGVEVHVDSPAVGSRLQDHPEGLVMWEARRPMVTRSTQWWEIGVFADTEPGLDRPDLMFHYGSVPFDMNTYRHNYPTSENAFCLTPNVTRARSLGTVRLRTRDFRDKPRVDPRYFTHEHDVRVMTYGLRLARAIVAQPPMADWAGAELAPGPGAETDEELLDYLRKTHNTVYHPAGTVRMGAADDPAAAVDPRLRVKGVRGLRVADASVMPFLPAVNPCITTMMIGEKCADMVREDARREGSRR